MLRPVLAWRAFWNLWTFISLIFNFFGRGKPRILNQWVRGHTCTYNFNLLIGYISTLAHSESCWLCLGKLILPSTLQADAFIFDFIVSVHQVLYNTTVHWLIFKTFVLSIIFYWYYLLFVIRNTFIILSRIIIAWLSCNKYWANFELLQFWKERRCSLTRVAEGGPDWPIYF
jgi:hypothetical protein